MLQLLFYLHELDNDQYQTVEVVSEQTGVPAPYLSKIVGLLARKDLVQTKKGPHGGVRLAEGTGQLPVRRILDEIGEFQARNRVNPPETRVQKHVQSFLRQCVKGVTEDVLGNITLRETVEKLEGERLELA